MPPLSENYVCMLSEHYKPDYIRMLPQHFGIQMNTRVSVAMFPRELTHLGHQWYNCIWLMHISRGSGVKFCSLIIPAFTLTVLMYDRVHNYPVKRFNDACVGQSYCWDIMFGICHLCHLPNAPLILRHSWTRSWLRPTIALPHHIMTEKQNWLGWKNITGILKNDMFQL